MNNNFRNKSITNYNDEDIANYIQSKIVEHDFQILYENLITVRTGKLVDLYFDENSVLQSKDIMIDYSNKLVFYCECCDEERYCGKSKDGAIASEHTALIRSKRTAPIASEPLIEFTYGRADFRAEKENYIVNGNQYISDLPSMYTSINSPNGTLKMISRVDKIQVSLKNYKGNNLPEGDAKNFFLTGRYETFYDKINSSRNKMFRKINIIKSIVSYCMKYEDSFGYNYKEDSGWKIKMDLDTAIEVVHGVLREKSWESLDELVG